MYAKSSIKHVPIKLLVGASSNVLEKYESCINYRSTMMYNMITSSTHQPYVPICIPIHMENACTMISTYASNNTSKDISMKLKYVPSMYTNRSTSIHTHGLVSCTRDVILHNLIDEYLNLQQTVSEPSTNNVRPCNKVLYHHIKMQSMCIAFFSRLYHIYKVCYTTNHVCT
jgi:hypothetical protein